MTVVSVILLYINQPMRHVVFFLYTASIQCPLVNMVESAAKG